MGIACWIWWGWLKLFWRDPIGLGGAGGANTWLRPSRLFALRGFIDWLVSQILNKNPLSCVVILLSQYTWSPQVLPVSQFAFKFK